MRPWLQTKKIFRPKIFRPKKFFFQSFQMVQFAKLSGQNRNLKTFSVFSPLRGHPCSTLRKFIQVKQVEHVKQDEQVEQDGQSWQVTMLVLKFRPSPTGTLQVWFSWTSWTSWIDWTTDILNCWKFEEVCLFFWTDVEPAGLLRYSSQL